MQMIAIEEFSIVAWAILGGLALMSVAAFSILLVKLAQFSRLGVGRRRVARQVATAQDCWRAGDLAGARAQTDGAPALKLQVLSVLMDSLAQHSRAEAAANATAHARDGVDALSHNMRGLEAVVQAAPMLGLLGTVVGMIEAFGKLAATSGAADPSTLASGIWTALVTTALGLAIAILFYLVSLWLEGRIAGEAQALERMIGATLQTTPERATANTPAASAAPSASPFSTTEPASPYAPPVQAPAPTAPSLAQPLPGTAPLQRTNPGLSHPQPHPGPSRTYPDPDMEDGPRPEGFQTRR